MEITRLVLRVPVISEGRGFKVRDCTACGKELWSSDLHIWAYADGDPHKTLYVVCSEECEIAIEEDAE